MSAVTRREGNGTQRQPRREVVKGVGPGAMQPGSEAF